MCTIIFIFIIDLFPILFQKLYREGVEEIFRKGYDLKADAVSVVAAKRARSIISNVCNLHLNAFLFHFDVCLSPFCDLSLHPFFAYSISTRQDTGSRLATTLGPSASTMIL